MEIRIRTTGQVMFWNEFRDLLLEQNPSELITVAPQTQEWLDQHGADVVLEGPQAQPTRYQVAFRDGVQQIGGQWFTKNSVADMDAEGIAAADAEQAKNIRQQRDQKLSALDWTQGKDIPDSVSNPAAVTRQALRDVPAQAGFPWEVVWPDAE